MIFHINLYSKNVVTPQVQAFCTECTYWNEGQERWMSDGCNLNPLKTTMKTTSCLCNHLTSFGGFFVAPNPLPTPSLDMLKNGELLSSITSCFSHHQNK